jgi:hypothetical protein
MLAGASGDDEVFITVFGVPGHLIYGVGDSYLLFDHDPVHSVACACNVNHMSTDPRVALSVLISCLEEHLSAVSGKRGAQDASISAAFLAVADAFEEYEDSLYEAYEEFLPLTITDEDDDDDPYDEEHESKSD